MAKLPPQSFISEYAARLRTYANPLLTPVIQPTAAIAAATSRTTKRGTTAINYAEDGYDYDDDDEDGGRRRRPTGLRSRPTDDGLNSDVDLSEKYGKEVNAPVQVQGAWRDWMGNNRSAFKARNDMQAHAQAALPLNLIPIRIDLDIPAFIPPPPLPIPSGAAYNQIDPHLPVYRQQEITVPYRLKDTFLWNLHETLTTTDQFAQIMVQDLDLPNKLQMALEISKQIRTQLEEYAGVALHPLFHSQSQQAPQAPAVAGSLLNKTIASMESRNGSATPQYSTPGTPQPNGTSTPAKQVIPSEAVTATANTINPDSDEYNPDDTYRCIVNLNVNLSSEVYTDRFEWSLLHPAGTAEVFAKQTCADIGLTGEWIPAMAHAIYEAVLRLKKEACESGGLTGYLADFPNQAAHDAEAGWRYDQEHLGEDWGPILETLSKEEIEKREGDRERQIRRMRRETARFSSTTNISTTFAVEPQEEERMGRGERSKKKRRFRSLTPERSGTPGRGTPLGGMQGYGGAAGGGLTDYERSTWRCHHCKVWGSSVWAVRDGPDGPKVRGLVNVILSC